MKISIFFLLTLIFNAAYGSDQVPDELRDEFRTLAASRLDYMMKNVMPTDGQLTMSFIVTDCRISSDPKIEKTGKSGFWKKRRVERCVCTSGVRQTVLTRFVCDTELFPIKNSQKDTIKLLTNIFVILLIIGVCLSWRNKCTRPVPIHPSNILNLSNKPNTSDEYEVITLDTTKSSIKSLSFNSFRTFFISIPKKFRIIV
uniref:Uncharacterized protein n=1 Tax=Caenorhabditis tropicalis TaxID=1561998 RepID=A0A1I7TDM8_9PELO